MAVKLDQKILHERWVQILIAVLVVLGIILIIKSQYNKETPKAPEGEIVKMMGIKKVDVEKSKSYQTINGVLNIQHWVTEHGVNVYFVPVRTLPMVDIEVIFDAGAARNGDKGGLAYLTNTLLADGASDGKQQITVDQIAEGFDNVGAQYHAESQRDMALVHLRSLSAPDQLVPAVKTLSQVLAQASFPEESFKREQQTAISALKLQSQKPQTVAQRVLFSMIYDKQPYGNWVLGDEASLNAITSQDIKAFYQKYYTAKNAVVAIVGDLSLQDADAIAQRLTNNLPEGEKAPALPEVGALTDKAVKKVDFPSAQTTILIGQPGITREDPDYYALVVGNHILGGNGSVTRIFKTIRNDNGLAYSAYSFFAPMRQKGPFVLGCQTRNDQAEKAENMMEALLRDFVKQGPTEQELEQAKQNLLGGYALQFDSNASICHEIAALGFYQLPLDHFNEFKEKVGKLTVDDIKSAFQKRVSPDNYAIVLVGGSPDIKEDTPPGIKNDIRSEPVHTVPGGAQG